MGVRWIALLGCLIWAAVPAWSLDATRKLYQYNIRTWTRQNGLPVNGINAITQARDGYVWLATGQGLVRFDGVSFTSVDLNISPEVRNAVVTSLLSSSSGKLWVAAQYAGFGYFDGKNFQLPNSPRVDGAPLHVGAFAEDADGSLLIATQQLAGRVLPNGDIVRLFDAANERANFIEVFRDAQGRIWFGSGNHGASYWQDGKLTQFPEIKSSTVYSIVQGKDGMLWFATNEGVRCFDAALHPHEVPQPRGVTEHIFVDSRGTVWLGTTDDGLARFSHGEYQYLRKTDGLAGDTVRAIYEDAEGSIWAGTTSGLSQLTDVKFPTIPATEDRNTRQTTSVAASQRGGIWIGSPGGVTYYNGKSKLYPKDTLLPSAGVKRVYEARNGDLYFVSGLTTLGILSGEKLVATHTAPNLVVGLADDDEGVVASIGGEVYRVDREKLVPYVFEEPKPDFHWILNLAPSRDDAFWVASERGLARVKHGKVIEQYDSQNGLGEDPRVTWVYEDRDGVVWGGMLLTGIIVVKDGRVHRLDRNAGLPDTNIYAVVADKLGNVWVDAVRGLFMIKRESVFAYLAGKATSVECVQYNGVESVSPAAKTGAQERVACVSNDGRIWFPMANGVLAVDPARIAQNKVIPPVHITRVVANDVRLPDGQTVVPPGRGEIELQFTALSFVAPEKLRFRYQLKGYDQKWVDAGERRIAFYTNLKPGRYTFQVLAANADGVWNNQGDTFTFELRPHFFQTRWFYAGCVLAVLALLGAIILWRTRKLRKKEILLQAARDELEKQVGLRTAELATVNSSLQREVEHHKLTAQALVERTHALEREIEERKQMQREIERVHQALVVTSRQAGMAEIATNVLHNVGNVLNSVNVSSALVLDGAKTSSVPGLAKAVALLRENENDLANFFTQNPRGKQLISYLAQLSDRLQSEQATAVHELELLRKNIEHIRDIVMVQQSYATVAGVKEVVSIRDVIEDSIRMNTGALDRHGVKLVRDFADVPPITVDKHKVMQILVNFVRNAKYACDEAERPDKEVVVRLRQDGRQVTISVIDNGVGIPPENLTRIFNHGFTTRKSGHGFGLHSGALAAREMGGSIVVKSDGVGRGASFTLELPVGGGEQRSSSE